MSIIRLLNPIKVPNYYLIDTYPHSVLKFNKNNRKALSVYLNSV